MRAAPVVNWVWLALAQQRLGKTEEARRRWLGEGAEIGSISIVTGYRPNAEAEIWFALPQTGWRRTSCAERQKKTVLASTQ